MTEPMRPALDEDRTAYGALLILDYLQELFLASGRDTFHERTGDGSAQSGEERSGSDRA